MAWYDDFQNAFDGFVKFVPMLKVLFALVVGFLWSGYQKIRSTRHEKRHKHALVIRWWEQHTTPMYIVLLVTLLCELATFQDELNASADEQEWDIGNASAAGVSANNISMCMDAWTTNQTLDAAHSPWVAQVASLTPIFATLTFLVNAVFTFRHVRRAEEVCLWDQTNRGATLWILQLPVVYSLCALFSVEKGLRQVRLGGGVCAKALLDGVAEYAGLDFFAEAGLSFGDGYEAIALLLFADITFNVIENTVDLVVQDAVSVRDALVQVDETIEQQLDAGHEDQLRSEFHLIAHENGKVMTRLGQMSEKLVHSTWTLSTLGIQYFAFTCLLIAIPNLLACQAFTWHMMSSFKVLTTFSHTWATTFKGMGLLGSCVAIHNMVSIETNFDEHFLAGFTAKWKFVSVKIMVSIVFIQQMLLPVAFGLTLPRANLFDASLRIIEFTFISGFNILAWPLEQKFYSMKAIDIEGMEDLEEDLLAGGDLGKLSSKFENMSSQSKPELQSERL